MSSSRTNLIDVKSYPEEKMKVTKLIVGILQIVLSLFILLQSCAAGVVNTVDQSKDVGGSVGAFVAILFMACGIVYIATRKMEKLGGDIAGLVLMIIAWGMSITNAKVYSDLQIWGWLALIIGVGFFAWHYFANRKTKSAK